MFMLLLINFLAFGVLACSAVGWISSIASLSRGGTLVPWTPRVQSPWGLVDLFACFVLLIFFSIAVAVPLLAAVGFVPKSISSQPLDLNQQVALVVADSVAKILTLLAFSGLLYLRYRVSKSDLGINFSTIASDIKLGFWAFVIVAPVIFSVQGLFVYLGFESKHPLMEMFRESPSIVMYWIIGFAAVIVAPIAEEFLFRLLLQGWIERFLSPAHFAPLQLLMGGRSQPEVATAMSPANSSATVVAEPVDGSDGIYFAEETSAPPSVAASSIESPNPYESPRAGEFTVATAAVASAPSPSIEAPPSLLLSAIPISISAIIFALMHYSHGPDWVALTILAVVLGYLYHRTHRLLPAIVVHFLLNFLSLLALYAEVFAKVATDVKP